MEILLRHRSFSDQHQWECHIAMALLTGDGVRLKTHHAEVAPDAAGCVPALIAIILLLPMPVPTNAVAISVIDREERAKGFLTEVARVVEASVAV